MKRRGFTLIELLAVIVILGVISVIAIPTVINIIKGAETDALEANEVSLVHAAENYYKTNAHLLPQNSYEVVTISLEFLTKEKLIGEIRNPSDQTVVCTGYVVVNRPEAKKFEYKPYLNCGSDLVTEGFELDTEEPGIVTRLDGNDLTVVATDETNISFTSESTYIDLGAPVVLSGDFTIEYWFKTNRATNYNPLNALDYTTVVGHSSDSIINFQNPTVDITTSELFITGQWQHIAITRTGLNIRIYRNGKEVGTDLWNGEIRVSKMGGKSDNSPWSAYNGSLKDVRIWSVARTQSQIQNSMHYGIKGNERTLLGFWPINEGENTVINDVKGNYSGTLHNSTWMINSGVKRLKIDNGAWLYTDNYTFGGLTTGSYTITVEDNVGNANSIVVSVP